MVWTCECRGSRREKDTKRSGTLWENVQTCMFWSPQKRKHVLEILVSQAAFLQWEESSWAWMILCIRWRAIWTLSDFYFMACIQHLVTFTVGGDQAYLRDVNALQLFKSKPLISRQDAEIEESIHVETRQGRKKSSCSHDLEKKMLCMMPGIGKYWSRNSLTSCSDLVWPQLPSVQVTRGEETIAGLHNISQKHSERMEFSKHSDRIFWLFFHLWKPYDAIRRGGFFALVHAENVPTYLRFPVDLIAVGGA